MCVIYSIVAMRKGGECDRGWDGSRGEFEDDMIVFLRCLKGRGGQLGSKYSRGPSLRVRVYITE